MKESSNSDPPATEEKVQRWILKDKWATEKNNAMSVIWDEMETVRKDTTYKALDRVKNKIKQIENPKKHLRIRRIRNDVHSKFIYSTPIVTWEGQVSFSVASDASKHLL